MYRIEVRSNCTMKPCTEHDAWFPIDHKWTLEGGRKRFVKSHTVEIEKSMQLIPRRSLCWVLDLFSLCRATCNMIIAVPMTERNDVILCPTKRIIPRRSIMLGSIGFVMANSTADSRSLRTRYRACKAIILLIKCWVVWPELMGNSRRACVLLLVCGGAQC